MKIGKFASKNNLSIDTIRHYMDIGLIVPEKQGGHYSFDSRCQKDLEEIIELKTMGFSLNEIKSIFLYKSFSKLTLHQEDLYFRKFFINKHRQIENEINQLVAVKQRLDLKIDQLNDQVVEGSNCTCGIDIQSLRLFTCVKCGNDLILSDASVVNNQIINGRLKCTCGEEYIINSGILMAGHPDFNEPPNEFDREYIVEYINATDASYLDNLYRGLAWGGKKIKQCSLDNKVIMDLGSGIGFFLRSIYDELPDNTVYLAVDYDIERHKFLKSLIESSNIRKNIIFICADFLQIPVKEKTVDIIADISGTSNYSFEHEQFLLELMDKYAKSDAYLFGSYILFKNFSKNSLIAKKYRDNFIEENVKAKIHKLNYSILEARTSDDLNKGGKYENYFVDDENVFVYSLFAKR